jgi:hypothetical protein
MSRLNKLFSFADDTSQCWSLGGSETWRAEINCRNHNGKGFVILKTLFSSFT